MKRFLQDKSGSVAITGGILAVPLFMAVGVAVDYTFLNNARSSLQGAADAAALASAHELGITNTRDATIQAVANNYVASSLVGKNNYENVKVSVNVSEARSDVTVGLSYTWTPFLIQYLDSKALPIKVSATATISGETNLCVLALEDKSDRAIDLGGNDGHITANNCIVHSNSRATNGISVFKRSTLNGQYIMTSGGFDGPQASFNPLPIVDSPTLNDPLINRQPPQVQNCDYKNFAAWKKQSYLKPGVYCGGLYVGGNVTAKLLPGDYIIKDGPLAVQGNASLVGDDVGFYFTGNNATFDFGVSTQVNLGARQSGPLSGILFFEDRNSPKNRNFTIRSKDAERFEGTIYLPKGRLWVDKASRVGQRSNWTAIIANKIAIGSGPQIVINTNYAASPIPVPDGIAPESEIRLAR